MKGFVVQDQAQPCAVRPVANLTAGNNPVRSLIF